MQKNDAIFLLLAGACALLFAWATFIHTAESYSEWAIQQHGAQGAAGQPRPVDLHQIRSRTEQGYLSNREALYYRPYVEPEP